MVKMVKAVVNDVVTYYPGRHYNEEVDNSVSTVKKFYTMGSTTVAVRTVSGTEDVLNWVLGDHYGAQRSTPEAQRRGLGSASVTATPQGGTFVMPMEAGTVRSNIAKHPRSKAQGTPPLVKCAPAAA